MLLLQLTLLMTVLCSAGPAGAGSAVEAPETAAEPGPRVRPRRLTRAEKGGYADNQEFMDEVCDLRSQTSSRIHHFWGNVEACNTVLDALQCLGFLQHLGDPPGKGPECSALCSCILFTHLARTWL